MNFEGMDMNDVLNRTPLFIRKVLNEFNWDKVRDLFEHFEGHDEDLWGPFLDGMMLGFALSSPPKINWKSVRSHINEDMRLHFVQKAQDMNEMTVKTYEERKLMFMSALAEVL